MRFERLRTETFRRWAVGVVFILFSFAYLLVGHHLGQDVDFDLLNYHFFDPYWLLVNHMRDIAPAYLQTYYNPLIDIPFYFGVRDLPSWGVGAAIALVQSLSFPLLYLIARRFVASRLLALLLAGLGMFTSVAITELGTIMGDTLTAPLVLASVYLALRAVSSSPVDPGGGQSRRAMRLSRRPTASAGGVVLAGVVAGIAAGLKLSGIPLAVGLVIGFASLAGPVLMRLRVTAIAGAGLIVGLLISYGWWGYEMTAKFGNPIFPYMNQVFHSKFASLTSNTDPTSKPHGIVQILFYPFYWTVHPDRVGLGPFRELSGPVLETLLILLLIKGVWRSVGTGAWKPLFRSDPERLLMTFAVVSYFVWVVEFGIYRYIVPVEMLAFLLIFLAGRRLFQDLAPRKVGAIGFAVLVAVTLATERVGYAQRPTWTAHYFRVSVPRPVTTEKAAFVMVGFNPNAYLIPYFPSDDLFIRTEFTVTSTPAFRSVISKQLKQFDHIYLLFTDPTTGYSSDSALVTEDASSWGRYGLKVTPGSCRTFSAAVGPISQGVHLCSLQFVHQN